MGVRKTTDLIGQITWGLAIVMVFFALLSISFVPKATSDQSVIQDIELPATNAGNLPSIPADQSTPAATPAE